MFFRNVEINNPSFKIITLYIRYVHIICKPDTANRVYFKMYIAL